MDDQSVESADGEEKRSLHVTDDGVLGMIRTNDPAVEMSIVTCNSSDDIFLLSDALPETSTIEHWCIKSVNVEAEQALKISALIGRMPFLELFEMNNCSCRGNMIRPIASSLANAEALQLLFLDSCGIRSYEMKVISDSFSLNHSMRFIGLDNNHLGRDGAIDLSSLIAKLPNLERLTLCDNHIGAEGAEVLAGALAGKQSFDFLNLAYNDIGNLGAVALEMGFLGDSIISHLDLTGNSIGPAGCLGLAQAIYENGCLEELDLSENPIGNSGAIALATLLTKNNTIKSLSLVGTAIEIEGATVLASAIASNHTIEFLDIRRVDEDMEVEDENAGGAYDQVFMDVIYDNESMETVLSSNHTLKRVIPAGDTFRSILALNQGWSEKAKQKKLVKFLNDKPKFILSTGMEEKSMPMVLEKVYRFGAMFELLRNMPDLFKSARKRPYRFCRKRSRLSH